MRSSSTRSGTSSARRRSTATRTTPATRLWATTGTTRRSIPRHRLLLVVVPGERDGGELPADRAGGPRPHRRRTDLLLTSDDYAPYATAIEEVYGDRCSRGREPGPGRPPKPVESAGRAGLRHGVQEAGEGAGGGGNKDGGVRDVAPAGLLAAALEGEQRRSTRRSWRGTTRRTGRRTAGSIARPTASPGASGCTTRRRTSSAYSYNFCWPVRTLRVEGDDGWRPADAGDGRRAGRPRLDAPGVAHLPGPAKVALPGHHPISANYANSASHLDIGVGRGSSRRQMGQKPGPRPCAP